MKNSEIVLATVYHADSSGIYIKVDGDRAAMQKPYKFLQTGVTLSSGNRVLVLKHSGTFVVLGKF